MPAGMERCFPFFLHFCDEDLECRSHSLANDARKIVKGRVIRLPQLEQENEVSDIRFRGRIDVSELLVNEEIDNKNLRQKPVVKAEERTKMKRAAVL